MAHGRSICRRCSGLLVRDMYGVWYHDGSQEGVERYNDDDHAPEPQQADLIAIRRAEQSGWERALERAIQTEIAAERSRIRDAVGGLGDNPPPHAKGREAMWQSALAAVLRIIDEKAAPAAEGQSTSSGAADKITTAQLDWMDKHGRK